MKIFRDGTSAGAALFSIWVGLQSVAAAAVVDGKTPTAGRDPRKTTQAKPKPKSNPTSARHHASASKLLAQKKHSEALAEIDKAIAADGDNPRLWSFRGVCHYRMKQYRKAADDFTQAIRKRADYALAFRNRVAVWKKLGENSKAIQDYTTLIRLEPKKADHIVQRAHLYFRTRKYHLAQADYTKAIALSPKVAHYWLCRGVTYTWLRDNRRAIDDYTKAISLSPRYAIAYNYRASCHYNLGDAKRGLTDTITGQILNAGTSASGKRMRTVSNALLLPNLESTFRQAHKVDVVVAVPQSATPTWVRAVVYVFARDQRNAIKSSWTCRLTQTGSVAELRAWLRQHAGELRLSVSGQANESSYFHNHVLEQFRFRPATRQSVPVDHGKTLVLSPRTLAHFTVERKSTWPATRYAVIVGEAHDNLEQQVAVLKGLESLFTDNPWLKQKDATAFLTEAWPANKPLSIDPLVKYDARPSDAVVYRGLASWLVTGYIAFEWKHQFGIPFIGHEDAEFYRLSNYLHWSIPDGRHSGANRAKADTLNSRFVTGRNAASGKTLVGALKKYSCPILFIGYGHVGPYANDDDWVRTPQAQATRYFHSKDLSGIVPADELARLAKTSHRSVASYLKEQKIGFIFLMPRHNVERGALAQLLESRSYLMLRQAQYEGKVDGYLKSLGRESTSCTVAPSPADAAAALAGGFQPNSPSVLASRVQRLRGRIVTRFKRLFSEAQLRRAELAELKAEARAIRREVEQLQLKRGETPSAAAYIGLRAERDYLKRWQGRVDSNPVVMQQHVENLLDEAALILGVDLKKLKIDAYYQKKGERDQRIQADASDGTSYFLPNGSRRTVVIGSNDLQQSRAMQLSVACHELIHVLQYNEFLQLNLGGTVTPAERWAWENQFAKGPNPNPVAFAAYARRERDAELRAARAVRKHFADRKAYRSRVFREATEYSQSYRKGIKKIQSQQKSKP